MTTAPDGLERLARQPDLTAPEAPIASFFRDVLAFTLSPGQRATLNDVYGPEGARLNILCWGRRSGKSRIASGIVVFEATVGAPRHLAAMPPGEQPTIMLIATSQRQAGESMSFVRQHLSRPALRPLVLSEKEDTVTLSTGIKITVMPCTSRAVRGAAVPVALLDETAWYSDADGSPMSLDEVLNGILPATAQFSSARVILTSTPRWAADSFATLARRVADGEVPGRFYHGTTAELNPSIPASFLAEQQKTDPAMYAREYEARFVSAVGAVFDEQAVRAAVADRGTLDPLRGYKYLLSTDPAYSGDRWAVAIGHMAGDTLVIDKVTRWAGRKDAPLQHSPVLDQIASMASAYNRATVLTDQYAAQPIVQGLRERGIWAMQKPWRNTLKTDAVVALRNLLYAGRIELPNDPNLLSELLAYEQHPLPSGKPAYNAPPGQHDDMVSALLALTHEVAAPRWEVSSWNYKDLAYSDGASRPVTRHGDLVLVGERYIDLKPHMEPWR
jgi:hypothetical protein